MSLWKKLTGRDGIEELTLPEASHVSSMPAAPAPQPARAVASGASAGSGTGSAGDSGAASLEQQIKALTDRGKTIEAIKLYREHTGLGLKESKDAVEDFARGRAPLYLPGKSSGAPGTSAPATQPLQGQERVDALIRDGKLIEAIKVHRELTGLGLKEAKDAVEDRRKALGL